MPTRADALRFVTDPSTSAENLQRACEILGLDADGAPDLVRGRLVSHVEALPAADAVVCLNPAAAPDALAVVRRFNDAFNRHDVDGIMAMMTPDCVFENTRPAPDGTRVEGAAAVRAVWERLFASSPQARFEFTDMFAAGDRALVLWTYHWVKDSGPGHVRGVDVFRVRDGKIAEKLSYVKG
jgi:ketosteroid isomerase-like protein